MNSLGSRKTPSYKAPQTLGTIILSRIECVEAQVPFPDVPPAEANDLPRGSVVKTGSFIKREDGWHHVWMAYSYSGFDGNVELGSSLAQAVCAGWEKYANEHSQPAPQPQG